jgi:hypothetical protein
MVHGACQAHCAREKVFLEPLTTRDVAIELLVSRAMDKADQKLLKLMVKRVGVALRTQRENGAVRSSQGPGQLVVWEVAR